MYRKIIGITMLELLLSLVLSTLVLSSLTTIYWVIQKHYYSQTAMITINENMRSAAQLLITPIHAVGYQGCLKAETLSIKPYENSDIKSGSDAITVEYVDTVSDDLLENMQNDRILYLTTDVKFSKNNSVMVSDCVSVDRVHINKVMVIEGKQKIVADKPLSKHYQKYADVSEYKSESYFVGKTNRVDKNNKPIYALYRKDRGAKKVELVDGVSDMKILYSMIENGHMVERAADKFYKGTRLVGIAMLLIHSSLTDSSLQYKQAIYVALRL